MTIFADNEASERLFAGPGAARALARSIDWAATRLGAVSGWPQSLRTAADICLASPFATALLWGPDLVLIHNDAQTVMLGVRVPGAMGRPAPEALSDSWPILGPLVVNALAADGRHATELVELAVELDRDNAPRPGHITVSVSAVHDESGHPAGVMISAVDMTARELADEALRTIEERMRCQNEAFQAAIDGAPLAVSLDLLARMAIAETGGDARAAFYIAEPDGTRLHPVWGAGNMSLAYLELADGFLIDDNSPASGLAIASGRPVLTRDVFEEPSWIPWRHLAEAYDYRACWSFPIRTRNAKPVGTFAMYFRAPRAAAPRDLALGDAVTRAAAIIVANLGETRGRARAEAAHRESEARFHGVADLVPDLLWESGADGSTPWFNARWYEHTGQTPDEAHGWAWMDAVHPDDRQRSAENYRAAIESGMPLVQEHRIRGVDGSYRWFLVRAEPQRDETGRIVRWFGAATDIHAHRTALDDVARQVEQRTAELSRASAALVRAADERDNLRAQLVAAEEGERRRLARELHDQLGQHLTGFAFSLAEVRRLVAKKESVEERLDQLEALSHAMARDARLLALELRPPELDDIGLESALDSYVEQWAQRAGVRAELTVTATAAQASVPGDVSTAIYRIVQEALNNVAKYARARHVSVALDMSDGELRLVVEDDGAGFDVASVTARVRRDRRLGLAGMLERATLVGGALEVETSPGSGTTIYVQVPIRDTPAEPAADSEFTAPPATTREQAAADITTRAAAAVNASRALTRQRHELLQTLRDVIAETRARRRVRDSNGMPPSDGTPPTGGHAPP